MAGNWKGLYEQIFTTTSSISVTHAQNRIQVALMVVIDGVVRNDLVDTVIPDSGDPRNTVDVTLLSSQSGIILVMDVDYIWGQMPTPESASTLSNAIHTDVAAEISAITLKPTPVGTDVLLIEDSASSNVKKSVRIGDLPTGTSLPVVDSTAVVKGSADATKLVRIEADGLTTGTTRVITMPDKDVTIDDDGDARPPTAHASNHTNGTDDIQNATAVQKGLATAAQITKLDGIEALADVTDAANVAAAGAVMETLADAKGDLFAASAADTVARLAVGSNNDILTADSAEATGVKWATPVPSVFANYYRAVAYLGITTSASTLPFDTTRIANAAFTLNGAGEELTINTASTYRIDWGCSSSETSGNDIVAAMWLELDTGSGFAEVGGSRSRWFHDSNGEDGGNAGFAIVVLAATDVIRIRAQVVGGSDQLNTLANSLRLSIQTVGADGAAGPQGPTGSGSNIIVADEGSTVSGGPHSNLNFVGSGVTATDAGSGVATITIPGGGSSANIAQYRQTGNLTINTSATTVVLNANDFQDSNYTRSGSNITINTAGVYRISYSVYFATNANARRSVDAWVENNTVEIVPSRSSSYSRNTSDDTANSTATFFVQLAATDVVRLRAQSTGTSGTAIGQGNRMWINLEFLRTP